jgi:hypothetical protein
MEIGRRGHHRARARSRLVVAGLAAVASVAGLTLGLGAGSASAAVGGTCEARGIGVDNNAPLVSVAQANPAFSPCASDHKQVLGAKVVAFPTVLGIGVVTVTAKALDSYTVRGDGYYYAQSDIAGLKITAPGLLVTVDAVHAQAASVSGGEGGSVSSGSSYLTKLRINGLLVAVGTGEKRIPLGLGLFLNLNEHSVAPDGTVTQRAISLTSDHPNNAGRHTEVAEAIAGPSAAL